ncbi:glycosyltransferase family 4 protein [Flavisolibacter nicotianae]|uniref:glycosyltransferase family 4 protein n=1 Tax=Flavisolibacter nicotianae TaxID=2364882 RepID=UPI000EAE4FF6|nr:glycosyltransferase family 4 protein [Flavisolibacter nicotianae]
MIKKRIVFLQMRFTTIPVTMMNILIATETLVVGGAETFVVRLCNELSLSHSVALFVAHSEMIREELVQQLRPQVKLFPCFIAARRVKQKADSGFRKLRIDFSLEDKEILTAAKNVVAAFRPDVVHSHLFKTDHLFARLKKFHGFSFRHVTTIHGDYSSFYHGEGNARMLHLREKMQFTVACLDVLACLCEEHRAFFETQFPQATGSKLHLIYNGYKPADEAYQTQTKRMLGLPENILLIGMVSRGVPKKGWEKAIAAFQQASLANAVLVLVGWSDYMAGLKEKYASSNILFAGFSANPLHYIQHFDFCLLPTLFPYESLPTVIMEYLFCRKPVIATHVGEIKKMITDRNGNEAGHLLDFFNGDVSVAQLAESMQKLAGEETRKAFAEVAGGAFEKFRMDNCVRSYLNLYQSA